MKSHAEFVQPCVRSTTAHYSFGRSLHAVWQQLTRWHALYRQRQQLAALSDEMLKDIGLSPKASASASDSEGSLTRAPM